MVKLEYYLQHYVNIRFLFYLTDTGLASSAYWCQPSTQVLTLRDKYIVQKRIETGWLNDDIISAASEILTTEFPIGGLRPSSDFEFTQGATEFDKFENLKNLRKVRHNAAFYLTLAEHHANRQIQILNVSSNHWILVSNCHEGYENDVWIYDSLNSSRKPSPVLVQSIAAVFRFSRQFNHFTTKQHLVGRQESDDCGIHAIAFAETVCQRKNPEHITFDNSKVIQKCTIILFFNVHKTLLCFE